MYVKGCEWYRKWCFTCVRYYTSRSTYHTPRWISSSMNGCWWLLPLTVFIYIYIYNISGTSTPVVPLKSVNKSINISVSMNIYMNIHEPMTIIDFPFISTKFMVPGRRDWPPGFSSGPTARQAIPGSMPRRYMKKMPLGGAAGYPKW